MKRDPNVIFEGSIPEHYDPYLGPALFESFAKALHFVQLVRNDSLNLA